MTEKLPDAGKDGTPGQSEEGSAPIDIHDRISEAYHGKHGSPMMHATRRRVHWICANVQGRRILDVGCSQGIAAILLGREGKKVTGIDIAKRSIEEARGYLAAEPENVRANVSFLHGDFLSHDFGGELFDTVILGEVLEHLLQPAAFIDAAADLLVENGRLIVTVPFGINDFPDHKHTFYLLEPYRLLSRRFVVGDVMLFGKWIGLIGQRRNTHGDAPPLETLPSDLVARTEASFFEIERKLVDQMGALKAQKIAADRAKKSERQAIDRANKLERQVSEANLSLTALKTELANAKEEISRQKRAFEVALSEKRQALECVRVLKASTSYRIGQSFVLAAGSPRGALALPLTLARLFTHALRRRRSHRATRNLQEKGEERSKRKNDKKIIELQNNFRIKTSGRGRLRVAAIMDEFTYTSFLPECELVQLRPDSWRSQLSKLEPDFVFIESAWQGVENLWKTKISNATDELISIVKYCKKQKIPSIFWNKEDPVHFKTFLSVAELVDYVFTTDIDCISRYKSILNHDRVFILPFAAQPKNTNPIDGHERINGFQFSGSYYLRYLERQRDFSRLIDAAKEFGGIDIFDRNYNNPHPHYTFPEKYSNLIKGGIPFSEIHKIYKGYRYGINVNTIKQSQSMFARRVFEVISSNSVIVSNFSRGLRNFFGDLVISSDNEEELRKRLSSIFSDETAYRKLRLMALRKVLMEHTYSHRLAYIKAKLSGDNFDIELPSVAVLAIARNAQEFHRVRETFRKQSHWNKELFVLRKGPFECADEDKVHIFSDEENCRRALLNAFTSMPLFALFLPDDYYGPEYLTDLALSTVYSDSMVFGKASSYHLDNGDCVLKDDGEQYRLVDRLPVRCSMARTSCLFEDDLKRCIANPDTGFFEKRSMLAVDEFQYCLGGGGIPDEVVGKVVGDLPLANQGVSFTKSLLPRSEKIPASNEQNLPRPNSPLLDARTLLGLMSSAAARAAMVKMDLKDKFLTLRSHLPAGQKTYLYAGKKFSRHELNLVSNSTIRLDCEGTLNLQTAFEYYDRAGEKISHSLNKAGDTCVLAIPEETETVRFGLRLEGPGAAKIRSLILVQERQNPSVVVGRTPFLVLTKQYPAYDDLYRYGFLHSRLRAYKQHGLDVDVFRITDDDVDSYREFEGIDVTSGNAELLEKTLASGQYKHVLVHLLDGKMWSVLQKYLGRISVTVWVHGAEIQLWQQREFDFEGMPPQEVERKKALSDQRANFWRCLLNQNLGSLNFVFVSKWFKYESESRLGVKFPENNTYIIHNFIDGDIFRYHEKDRKDRLNILTIGPYSSKKYANDLSVNTIVELSKRPFFGELKFSIIGDGDLFDETVAPLTAFSNVTIERRFLTHAEVAEYHRQHGVLLVPTRMDTQGVSRDEAMASGLVPITTNVAAIPEFVDETCGIVVPPEDPKALADAIEYLYRNPEAYLSLSKAASERVRKQSGFEQTIKREMQLITEFSV